MFTTSSFAMVTTSSIVLEISSKGSFSFNNDNILMSEMTDNVHLWFGFAVARLFNVDEGNAEINIPDQIEHERIKTIQAFTIN